MKLFADFHIHSRFSQATSKNINIKNLYNWSKKKGINILGTGDFTHPLWLKEIRENLEPAEEGLLKVKNENNNNFYFRFIITGEVSLVYNQGGKTRKIHHIIFVPTLEAASQINKKLSFFGNLNSDGRPILRINSKDLLKIILEIDKKIFLVPAHAWTPWFGVFGSKSGFDSLEECFGDLSKEIFAIETGLSSDPKMNWLVPELNRITLISNSDAHSLQKIGREANVFDILKKEISFSEIRKIIKNGDKKRFLYTIEFFPQEGKYYYDGHRNCGFSIPPQKSKKEKYICPLCKKPLTLGVLHRIEKISKGKRNKRVNKIPFKSIIPLPEIISQALGKKSFTKKAEIEYNKLISFFGNEMNVLLEAEIKEINKISLPKIAEGVKRVREGKLIIEPGFDGQYGKIKIWPKDNTNYLSNQNKLF